MAPFFGLYGQDPMQYDLSPAAVNDNDDGRAHTTARVISEIYDHLRAELRRAQHR